MLRLRSKLARELSQSEQSARTHPLREARRLGDVPPARALRVLAAHAIQLEPRLEALLGDQPLGTQAGRAVGRLFSALRHGFFDRLIDAERSYRGTLLGIHHGLDCARLLGQTALTLGEIELAVFCDELIISRTPLLEDATRALAWFAIEPGLALRSGLRPPALAARART